MLAPLDNVLNRLFDRLEASIDPFPSEVPDKPPVGFWPFFERKDGAFRLW